MPTNLELPLGLKINALGHKPYRLERLLGTGRIGTTYLATTPDLQAVALKVLAPDWNKIDPGEIFDRFIGFSKETQVLERLRSVNHPNIIHFIGAGKDQKYDIAFIALEFANRGSWGYYIKRKISFTPEYMTRFTSQTANGLQVAHNMGIIHRDVKPANLLLHLPEGENMVKLLITDFDISLDRASNVSIDELLVNQDGKGTYVFMAPEQFAFKAIPSSDQYSLAASNYYDIEGTPPFQIPEQVQDNWNNLNELQKWQEWHLVHLNSEVRPFNVQGVNAPFAEEVFPVVRRGLSVDSHKRFPTINDYGQAFWNAYQKIISEPEKPVGFISYGKNIGNKPAENHPAEQLTVVYDDKTIQPWNVIQSRPDQFYNANTLDEKNDPGMQNLGNGYVNVPLIEAPAASRRAASLPQVWQDIKDEVRDRLGDRRKFAHLLKLLEIGELEEMSNRLEPALQAYEKVLSIDPINKTALQGKANVFFKAGDFRKAADTFAVLAKMEPGNSNFQLYIGDSLLSIQEYDLALTAYDEALAIAPTGYLYFKKGSVLIMLFRYEDAIQEFDRALLVNPGNLEAILAKGFTLSSYLREHEKALEAFDQFLAVYPHASNVLKSRGDVLIQLGKIDEALQTYKKALSVDGSNDEAKVSIENLEKQILSQNKTKSMTLVLEGKKHETDKEYTVALKRYDEAIQLYPENSTAYFYSGNVMVAIDELELALQQYEKAIQIDKRFADAFRRKGEVLKKLNEPEEALLALEQAISLSQRQDSLAFVNKAYLLINLNREEEALEALISALLVHSPKNPKINETEVTQKKEDLEKIVRIQKKQKARSLVLTASDYEKQMQTDDALEFYNQACLLDPDNSEAFFGKGNMLYIQKKYTETIEALNQAIALDNENSRAYIIIGNSFLNLDKIDEALNDYDKALDIEPANLLALNGKGIALYKKGSYKDALKEFETVLKINPAYYPSIIMKGNVLRSLKKPNDALDMFKKALTIESRNSIIYSSIGSALFDLKRYEEALRSFETALILDKNNTDALNGKRDVLEKIKKQI